MLKHLFTPLLLCTSLYAEETEEIPPLDPEVVQSLYIESALFVAVFTLMSIVSIVISKKHAAQNALKDKKKREAQKETEKNTQSTFKEESKETQRVTELSKMQKDGLITDEEFQVLSHASKTNPNT